MLLVGDSPTAGGDWAGCGDPVEPHCWSHGPLTVSGSQAVRVGGPPFVKPKDGGSHRMALVD